MYDFTQQIKNVLSNTNFAEPVQSVAYPPNEAPDLPYIIVIDTITSTGSDTNKGLILHDLVIERYSTDADYNEGLEQYLNSLPAEWTRETVWLPAPENCFETIYNLATIADNT